MLAVILPKIDRFVIVLAVILAAMALVVVISLRTIFTSLNTAGNFVEGEEFSRVDKQKLEEVYSKVIK